MHNENKKPSGIVESRGMNKAQRKMLNIHGKQMQSMMDNQMRTWEVSYPNINYIEESLAWLTLGLKELQSEA